MFELVEYCSFEMEVKASRFLAEGFPVKSTEEVRKILKEQKQKYKDATHVVHAFSVGLQAEILGSSDDGEPSGTSGGPALNIIKNGHLTNTLITITRWFGGTLLGTGGLVKAYGGVTKKLLEIGITEEIIEKKQVSISLSYPEYNSIKNDLLNYEFILDRRTFTTVVTLEGSLPKKRFTDFAVFLQNATSGRINLT